MQKRQASFSLGVRGSPKESAGTGDGEERGSEPPPDRGNALLLPLSRGWGGFHLEAQFWHPRNFWLTQWASLLPSFKFPWAKASL